MNSVNIVSFRPISFEILKKFIISGVGIKIPKQCPPTQLDLNRHYSL